jgi:pantoate--beta-alanine ligase
MPSAPARPRAKAAAAAQRKLAHAGFRSIMWRRATPRPWRNCASPSDPVRLLAAAWLADTRLIDNVGV